MMEQIAEKTTDAFCLNLTPSCVRGCLYCKHAVLAGKNAPSSTIVPGNLDVHGRRILFPGSHDLGDLGYTHLAALQAIDLSDNTLEIYIKPSWNTARVLAWQLKSIFSDHLERVTVVVSMTSISNDISQFWEYDSPCPGQRLEALDEFLRAQIRVRVTIEPFLDYTPLPLVEKIRAIAKQHAHRVPITVGTMYRVPAKLIKQHRFGYAHLDALMDSYEPTHLREIYSELSRYEDLDFTRNFLSRMNME